MHLRLLSVFVPLMLIGVIGGHALANAAVGARADQTEIFTSAANGEMFLPALLAVLAAAALVSATVGAGRARTRQTSIWFLAALPFVFFTGLELFEAILAHHSLLRFVVLAPAFELGLAFQLPVAAVCFLCAHLLLGLGRAVWRSLAACRSWTPLYVAVATGRSKDDTCARDLRLDRIRSRGPPVALRLS